MSDIDWKLSRYWNRLAFFIIDIGRKMLWDQTGSNGDLLKYMDDECDTVKRVLT